ncbi:MAG: class I SAM-dependent methyltransferase, partial [Candidatus Binataceae bacterium]
MPLEEEIGKAYRNYLTHLPADSGDPPPRLYKRAVRMAKSAYLACRFGYGDLTGQPWRWILALPVYLSPLHRPELDRPLSYLTGRKVGRLLDVGCGAGDWLRLAEKLGWHTEGVDFDPGAVANARSTGLSVRSGQVADQNFPDRTFDLILMSHLIEHVHDPVGVLRECHRVLKDDGLLVVWTPNSDGWVHGRFGKNWTGLHPPYHLWL